MQAIEFHTTVSAIMSAMPRDKRQALSGHPEDEIVRVIVLASPRQQMGARKDLLLDAQEKGYDNFLDYLMDHPLAVPHPIRFTREALHER